MSLYKWSSNASLSFSTSTISSMQDILCDTGNLAWHPIEAGKIININEHQSLRSLKNIDSIEVKTKYLPYTCVQLQHITAYRYFFLLYYAMQRVAVANCMSLLDSNIQLNINAGIFNIMHRQVVTLFIQATLRHFCRGMNKMDIL